MMRSERSESEACDYVFHMMSSRSKIHKSIATEITLTYFLCKNFKLNLRSTCYYYVRNLSKRQFQPHGWNF